MSPEFEQIRNEFDIGTAGFTEEDWLRAPSGKWNSILISEHLILAYAGTTLGLLKAIHSGAPSATKMTLRHRIATFMVTRLGFLPSGREAPREATPKGKLTPNSIDRLAKALLTLDARLAQAEKRFGAGTKVLDHPALGPLTAQEWRRFHRTHSRHHLKQIEQRAKRP